MGACNKKAVNERELLHVPVQDLLMDSSEVRILKVRGTHMQATKDHRLKQFDGYLQRGSYFVLPNIDKLRKDKLSLKSQTKQNRHSDERFTNFRVVNGGSQVTDPKRVYYVNPL